VHIAFVTTESPYGDAGAGGIAAYLRAIIPEIVAAGHRVSVLANAKEEKDFSVAERISVRHFRTPSLHWQTAKVPFVRSMAPLPLRQFEWSKAFYRQAVRVAAQTQIDVIESTETGSMFLSRIAPLVIRLHGSELTFRQHSAATLNLSVKWNDRLEGYGCSRAMAITAPSQYHADEIIARRGWSPGRVHVIPNPISATLLRAALQFQRNGSTERIVLYTGRLAPVKGVETLLAAAKLIHHRDPSVSFVLAGPWQMPRPPHSYGLQLNQQSTDGVRWIGPLDQKELVSWYQRASLFVAPSYYESFGLSLIEAMAFGLRIIATATSGVVETLGDKTQISVVPKGDPQALANAVCSSFSQPGDRQLADVARAQVSDLFNAECVAAATLKLYESIRR